MGGCAHVESAEVESLDVEGGSGPAVVVSDQREAEGIGIGVCVESGRLVHHEG